MTTAEWVDWFNHTRLHTWCDNRPPAEYETLPVSYTHLTLPTIYSV